MAEEKEAELVSILARQDKILDEMLVEQKKIHEEVKSRNWTELQYSIANMDAMSNEFVSEDEKREKLGADRSVYMKPAVEPLYVSIRSKLAKSKIENEALNKYVNATRTFIDGVIEECIPQRRNVLYSPKGIVKKPVESVVINTLF